MEDLIKSALVEHLDSTLRAADIAVEQGISAEALTIIISETKSYVNTTFVGFHSLIPNFEKQRSTLIAIYIYHYLGLKLNIQNFGSYAATRHNQLLPSLAEIIIHFIALLDDSSPTSHSTPDVPMSPVVIAPVPLPKPAAVSSSRKTRTNESSKIKALLGLKPKSMPVADAQGSKSKHDLTHQEELPDI